jgi:hypothetical protein
MSKIQFLNLPAASRSKSQPKDWNYTIDQKTDSAIKQNNSLTDKSKTIETTGMPLYFSFIIRFLFVCIAVLAFLYITGRIKK